MDPLSATSDGLGLEPNRTSAPSADYFIFQRKNEASMKIPLNPTGDKIIGKMLHEAIGEYLSSRMGEMRFRKKHDWITKWRELRYSESSTSEEMAMNSCPKVFDYKSPSLRDPVTHEVGRNNNSCGMSLKISQPEVSAVPGSSNSKHCKNGGVKAAGDYVSLSSSCSQSSSLKRLHSAMTDAHRCDAGSRDASFKNTEVEHKTQKFCRSQAIPPSPKIISQLKRPSIENMEHSSRCGSAGSPLTAAATAQSGANARIQNMAYENMNPQGYAFASSTVGPRGCANTSSPLDHCCPVISSFLHSMAHSSCNGPTSTFPNQNQAFSRTDFNISNSFSGSAHSMMPPVAKHSHVCSFHPLIARHLMELLVHARCHKTCTDQITSTSAPSMKSRACQTDSIPQSLPDGCSYKMVNTIVQRSQKARSSRTDGFSVISSRHVPGGYSQEQSSVENEAGTSRSNGWMVGCSSQNVMLSDQHVQEHSSVENEVRTSTTNVALPEISRKTAKIIARHPRKARTSRTHGSSDSNSQNVISLDGQVQQHSYVETKARISITNTSLTGDSSQNEILSDLRVQENSPVENEAGTSTTNGSLPGISRKTAKIIAHHPQKARTSRTQGLYRSHSQNVIKLDGQVQEHSLVENEAGTSRTNRLLTGYNSQIVILSDQQVQERPSVQTKARSSTTNGFPDDHVEEHQVETCIAKATREELVRNPKYRTPSVAPGPITTVRSGPSEFHDPNDCIVISSDDDHSNDWIVISSDDDP